VVEVKGIGAEGLVCILQENVAAKLEPIRIHEQSTPLALQLTQRACQRINLLHISNFRPCQNALPHPVSKRSARQFLLAIQPADGQTKGIDHGSVRIQAHPLGQQFATAAVHEANFAHDLERPLVESPRTVAPQDGVLPTELNVAEEPLDAGHVRVLANLTGGEDFDGVGGLG
jgi:hypothetical protein